MAWKKTKRKVGGRSGKSTIHNWDGNHEWLSVDKFTNGDYFVFKRKYNSITNRWGGMIRLGEFPTESEAVAYAKQYMKTH